MKYLIVLCDGMADEVGDGEQSLTPMQKADTPAMDKLAQMAEIGMVNTIPEGMSPGSDTANLSVLGYDPQLYYTGRSPLEALSIGVEMEDSDIAIRCNLVTVSDEEEQYGDKTMIDHSAGEISTEEAHELLQAVGAGLGNEWYYFYTGTSYRHLTIWKQGKVIDLTPPHDILGSKTEVHLPKDDVLYDMTVKSYSILKDHPVNQARRAKGLHPANSIWFWGAGTKPALSSFEEKTGKKGAMISAVDLLKGIAIGADMKVIEVKGADGTLHTNYAGKAEAAIGSLLDEGDDFVYIHIEAPDEMGHQGSYERKVQAIEMIDEKVVSKIIKEFGEKAVDYRMLILPDHPTPVHLRTHTSNPVPYLLYDSSKPQKNQWKYNEEEAQGSGHRVEKGHLLIDVLLQSESV